MLVSVFALRYSFSYYLLIIFLLLIIFEMPVASAILAFFWPK